tara:strand:+ start:1015 stop:1371 length:357 start_codon:yes stop_codon:yes gene_type:complete
MPGIVGHFVHEVETDLTISCSQDKIIWGISASDDYTFERALKAINPDYRQLFYDKTIGAIGFEKKVEFEIVLGNGNHTKECYENISHKDDYEISSENIFIKGRSFLIKRPERYYKKAV